MSLLFLGDLACRQTIRESQTSQFVDIHLNPRRLWPEPHWNSMCGQVWHWNWNSEL